MTDAMKITFVLPGRGRSGGVRVTVEMGNCLLKRGHDVRIIYYRPALYTPSGLKRQASYVYRQNRFDNADWVDSFEGTKTPFNRLEDVSYSTGEIVISVGVFFVPYLLGLKDDVHKVQYCHGLPGDERDPLRAFLDFPIPTISVSDALVETLEKHSGEKVLGVVPNGIDSKNYYTDGRLARSGIGTIYDVAYEKAPEDTIELIGQIRKRWPSMPRYVFGKMKRPKGIDRGSYFRYPSIPKGRELYSRSKIWLVTSRREGFGLPVLEAMACGALVISTKHDNAYSLIKHGENGFLVDVGDHEGFMRYIEFVLNNDDVRQRITRQAYKTVKKYTWDRAAEKMVRCLKSVVLGDQPILDTRSRKEEVCPSR